MLTMKIIKRLCIFSSSALLLAVTSLNTIANDVPPSNTASSAPSAIDISPTQSIRTLLPPFKATYNILRQSDVVGKATRTLSYTSEHQALYQFKSKIEWFIFSDIRTEESVVNVDNGTITPLTYNYVREGTGPDKHEQFSYHHAAKTIVESKSKQVIVGDLPDNIQDQLSHHLTLQQALITHPSPFKLGEIIHFDIVKTSGRLKEFTYEYEGTFDLMLPYGLVKAVKFKKENSKKTRATYVWFAPSLNYALVKLFQTKSGVEQFETQLTSLE